MPASGCRLNDGALKYNVELIGLLAIIFLVPFYLKRISHELNLVWPRFR